MVIRLMSIFFINARIADLRRRQPPSPPSPEATDFFMIGPFDDINEEPQAAAAASSPPGSPSPPPPPLSNIDTNEIERMGDVAGRNALLTEVLAIPRMIPNIVHYVEIALDFWNPEQHLRRIHRLLAFSAREGPFQRIGHGQVIQNSYLLRTPIVRLQGNPDRVFSVVMFEISERNNNLHSFLYLTIVNNHAQIDMPMNIVEQQVVFPLVQPYPWPPMQYMVPMGYMVPMRFMVVVAYEQRNVFNVDDLRRQCRFRRSTFNPTEFARNLHLRQSGALTFQVSGEIIGIWAGRHYIVEGHLYN